MHRRALRKPHLQLQQMAARGVYLEAPRLIAPQEVAVQCRLELTGPSPVKAEGGHGEVEGQ